MKYVFDKKASFCTSIWAYIGVKKKNTKDIEIWAVYNESWVSGMKNSI
jgi:hypothetical protein